jgi:hypothetical protein
MLATSARRRRAPFCPNVFTKTPKEHMAEFKATVEDLNYEACCELLEVVDPLKTSKELVQSQVYAVIFLVSLLILTLLLLCSARDPQMGTSSRLVRVHYYDSVTRIHREMLPDLVGVFPFGHELDLNLVRRQWGLDNIQVRRLPQLQLDPIFRMMPPPTAG